MTVVSSVSSTIPFTTDFIVTTQMPVAESKSHDVQTMSSKVYTDTAQTENTQSQSNSESFSTLAAISSSTAAVANTFEGKAAITGNSYLLHILSGLLLMVTA